MHDVPFDAILEHLSFILLIILIAPCLGVYIFWIFETPKVREINGRFCRLCGIDPSQEMTWVQYTKALLVFNFLGFIFLFLILIFQENLPWNPQAFPNLPALTAFNIAASFTTNTDWQAYAGETTLSYFSQMAGLTVQNFLSASTGFAVFLALVRSLKNSNSKVLGNFWCDIIRFLLFILLPLSIVFALLLMQQGVIQNLRAPLQIETVEHAKQMIPLGPVASQVAIKQIGSNGGGFFKANGAHPFENPTPFTNLLEMIAIILIPAATCFAYGLWIDSRKQGLILFFSILIVLTAGLILSLYTEYAPNPIFDNYPLLEGKEQRNGTSDSVLWILLSAANAHGSSNASLDSLAPLTGGIAYIFIILREVFFGAIGVGFSTLIMFLLLTVFLCGLAIGRTPEYLGKKIEKKEIKWAILAILIPSACIFIGLTFDSLMLKNPHYFGQLLFTFSSASNNTGLEIFGFDTKPIFYQAGLGMAMIAGRLANLIPVLVIAGSLAEKKAVASSSSLDTSSVSFGILLVLVIFFVAFFIFTPFLALGPIMEQMKFMKGETW